MRCPAWVLLLAVLPVPAQEPRPRQEAARKAMAAAVEQQRASVQASMEAGLAAQRTAVRVQADGAVERNRPPDSFLTIPWPQPLGVPSSTAECDPLPRATLDPLIAATAEREGLNPELLREVMRRESAFRPCAISRAGAKGLMQLMPATAEQFHLVDPLDPRDNVAAGAKLLRTLLDRYSGDLELALGAYNAGPTRVDEAGGVPDIRETRDYVGTILRAVLIE